MFIGAVKLTKNTETSNHKYVGYGICFDEGSNFSIGNINNNIIVLGKDLIQGLTTTGTGNTIYVEKIYKANMTEPNKKFVLSLHYNGDDSYLFVNGLKRLKFKAQSFTNNMKSQVFGIGNISSDWSLTNSTKTSLYGNIYDFGIDYEPFSWCKNNL